MTDVYVVYYYEHGWGKDALDGEIYSSKRDALEAAKIFNENIGSDEYQYYFVETVMVK